MSRGICTWIFYSLLGLGCGLRSPIGRLYSSWGTDECLVPNQSTQSLDTILLDLPPLNINPFHTSACVCFVARMGAWFPFIVWHAPCHIWNCPRRLSYPWRVSVFGLSGNCLQLWILSEEYIHRFILSAQVTRYGRIQFENEAYRVVSDPYPGCIQLVFKVRSCICLTCQASLLFQFPTCIESSLAKPATNHMWIKLQWELQKSEPQRTSLLQLHCEWEALVRLKNVRTKSWNAETLCCCRDSHTTVAQVSPHKPYIWGDWHLGVLNGLTDWSRFCSCNFSNCLLQYSCVGRLTQRGTGAWWGACVEIS